MGFVNEILNIFFCILSKIRYKQFQKGVKSDTNNFKKASASPEKLALWLFPLKSIAKLPFTSAKASPKNMIFK